MATFDDLFGKKNSDTPRTPSSPKWEAGVVHQGVITGEPFFIDEVFWDNARNRPGKAKYMVETGEGGGSGWQVKAEGDFDESLPNFKLQQIGVPVKLEDGTDVTFKYKKNEDELKNAMQESDLPIAEGITIGRKCLRMEGKRAITVTKLAK